MIEVEFAPADYRRIRFAFSAVGEAVKSLRVLSGGRRSGLHGRWLSWVGTTDIAHQVDVALLTTVVRPQGYLPDFLGPVPPGRHVGFAEGLAQVAATPVDVVRHELSHLAGHPVAQQGAGRDERAALMAHLLADPDRALRRIVEELGRYWQLAIEPHWPRIHALLQADLAYRLEELGSGGAERLFASLHPSVAFRGDLLTVVKYYQGRVQLRGRGLMLVPSAFAWPDVLISTADPQPSLTYGSRGLGILWETGGTPPGTEAPLAAVLGTARANILALLELPMSTTQLATQLDATPPTVNAHLKALHRAGIVTSRRDGRVVLYRSTPLGDQLVAGRTD